MKIILWSKDNPKLKSGYGIGGANLGPRLENSGHEMVYYSPVGHRGYIDSYKDIPILPGEKGEPFEEDALITHYEKTDPDLVLSWCDINPLSETPKYFSKKSTRHWISYAPIDFFGITDSVLKKISAADKFVPFCQDAYDRLEDYGVNNLHDPIYHGIDTDLWRPLDNSKYPKAMQSLGFTENGFNILIDAANQRSRKAWGETMEAISMFRDETDLDINVYIHSHPYVNEGWPLPMLAEHFNLDDCTNIADDYHKAYGLYSEQEMVIMYNLADVAMVPGVEGFGWSHIQAQAVQTPVIALNAGPAPELVKAGVLVPPKEYRLAPDLMQRPYPNQEALAAALDTIANSSSNWSKGERWVRKEGGFDWDDDIIPQWRNLLTEFQQEVDTKCTAGPPDPSPQLNKRASTTMEVEP